MTTKVYVTVPPDQEHGVVVWQGGTCGSTGTFVPPGAGLEMMVWPGGGFRVEDSMLIAQGEGGVAFTKGCVVGTAILAPSKKE